VDYWSNTRVRLNDSWGPGAAHSLATPLGRQPEFSLHPRHLRDPQGNRQVAHFTIEFPSGFLADGWQGVNFVPMGSTPVTGISGLPAWDPSQQANYRKVIEAAATALADPRTLRLEALIPFFDKGVGYNYVRLFYVPKAVSGPIPDLVVIKTATHSLPAGTVQGRQDGTGQGPPDYH
jgi:hypothetical protein